jgi:hypothetical protein
MTFTPVQGPDEEADEAGETGAEVVGWLAAGAEQAARVNRRPAAARELAAAVRIVVKVTCQGYSVAGQERDAVACMTSALLVAYDGGQRLWGWESSPNTGSISFPGS